MRRYKDIIYDYNDVFVALIIVIIAGAIIFWRISDILGYSEYIEAKNAENGVNVSLEGIDLTQNPDVLDGLNEDPEDIDTTGSTTPGAVTDPATPVVDPPAAQQDPPAEPVQTGEFKTKEKASFTVPTGVSASKIGQLLFDAGLVESKEAFMKTMQEKNAETKLMAGTFNIPAGSTAADIVDILTR